MNEHRAGSSMYHIEPSEPAGRLRKLGPEKRLEPDLLGGQTTMPVHS
jgi:hypothetical protein